MRAVALVLVLAACSDGDVATTDAGPCTGAPGVRVRVDSVWFPGDVGFTLTTTGGVDRYAPLAAGVPMENGYFVVDLPYPAGTVAGPASLDFRRLGPGVCDTVGHVDFTADPTTCIEVTLTTSEVCPADAGP